MNPSGSADPRPVFSPLRGGQKRLLWFAAFVVVLVGAAVYAYYYVSSAPQRAQQQFQDAMNLMKPGHYEDAIAGFDRALKTWPNLADAYLERGNANHILNLDYEAIADFERAIELNPSLPAAYAALGAIYRDRRDYKRALEFYTKSLDGKTNVDAYYERGQMYESLGEHQKAIEDYDRALAETPDSPAVYRARGLARRNLGDEAGYQQDRDMADSIERRH